jgi:hypothetical protein
MFRIRPSLAITMSVSATLLSACLTAGPGACDSDNRAFFDAIQQFDGMAIEAEDHPLGVCGAVFTTDASVDAVVDHYAAEFEAVGWDVGGLDTGPAGEPGVTSVSTVSAYRDTFQYHVSVSELETGGVQVMLMAGDAQS